VKNTKSAATNLIGYYYYATPVFFLLDYAGLPLRVSENLPDNLRYAYYLFCVGCAAICFLRPGLEHLVAIIESSLNLLILASAVVLIDIDGVIEGTATTPFTGYSLFTFMLSAGVLICVFQISVKKLRDG
jgi:hypothetical protein